MRNRELEIKIKLDDRQALIKKAEGLGARKLDEGIEFDIMYNDAAGSCDFDNPKGKHLRLRKAPYGNLLTYKEKGPRHEHLLDRTEIQTPVSDYEAMDQILQKLGFYHFRVKEKHTAKYQLDGFVLEFHKLPFLGDFLEIEAGEQELTDILSKLGLNIKQGINKGYSILFRDFCRVKGLPEDIPQTFDEAKKHGLQ